MEVKWKHIIHILCSVILVLNGLAWLLWHIGTCACICSVAHFCPTLCHNLDCHLPDSSVHGISQARTLEWVTLPSFRGPSQPRDPTCISFTGRQIFFTAAPLGKPILIHKGLSNFFDSAKSNIFNYSILLTRCTRIYLACLLLIDA